MAADYSFSYYSSAQRLFLCLGLSLCIHLIAFPVLLSLSLIDFSGTLSQHNLSTKTLNVSLINASDQILHAPAHSISPSTLDAANGLSAKRVPDSPGPHLNLYPSGTKGINNPDHTSVTHPKNLPQPAPTLPDIDASSALNSQDTVRLAQTSSAVVLSAEASTTIPASASSVETTPLMPLSKPVASSDQPTEGTEASSAAAVELKVPAASSALPNDKSDKSKELLAKPPPPMTLAYQLNALSKGLAYQADARLEWQHDKKQYSLVHTVTALFLGSRTYSSRGLLTEHGIAPERYEENNRKKQTATNFSYQRNEITFSSSENNVPLTLGAQDRLSVLLQLAAIANANPGVLNSGTAIEIQVAGTRDADIWRFRAVAQETLNTPLGSLPTLHLLRLPRSNSWDQKVETWLSPQYHWMPVRIKISDPNGDYLDQTLTSSSP